MNTQEAKQVDRSKWKDRHLVEQLELAEKHWKKNAKSLGFIKHKK